MPLSSQCMPLNKGLLYVNTAGGLRDGTPLPPPLPPSFFTISRSPPRWFTPGVDIQSSEASGCPLRLGCIVRTPNPPPPNTAVCRNASTPRARCPTEPAMYLKPTVNNTR